MPRTWPLLPRRLHRTSAFQRSGRPMDRCHSARERIAPCRGGWRGLTLFRKCLPRSPSDAQNGQVSMGPKKYKVAVALALTGLLTIFAWLWVDQFRQPIYRGKRVGEWFHDMSIS